MKSGLYFLFDGISFPQRRKDMPLAFPAAGFVPPNPENPFQAPVFRRFSRPSHPFKISAM